LADTRPIFWAAEQTFSGIPTEPCGTPFTPPCPPFEEETLSLVTGHPLGNRQLDVEPDMATVSTGLSQRATVSADGRFLTYAGSDGTVHFHDRVWSSHEVLPGDGLGRWSRPLMSDDGKVIVVGRGGFGWFEYLAEGA
jgi:hypothetical protein